MGGGLLCACARRGGSGRRRPVKRAGELPAVGSPDDVPGHKPDAHITRAHAVPDSESDSDGHIARAHAVAYSQADQEHRRHQGDERRNLSLQPKDAEDKTWEACEVELEQQRPPQRGLQTTP